MIPAAVLRRRPGLLSLKQKTKINQITQLTFETMKEKSTDLSKWHVSLRSAT